MSISWGSARAVGATTTHMLGLDAQPWIIYQISRGENPPAQSNSSAGSRPDPGPACISIPPRKDIRQSRPLSLPFSSSPSAIATRRSRQCVGGWRPRGMAAGAPWDRQPLHSCGWRTPPPPLLPAARMYQPSIKQPHERGEGPCHSQRGDTQASEVVGPAQVHRQDLV